MLPPLANEAVAPVITIRPFRDHDKAALYDMLAEVWPGETPEQHDRRWWWGVKEMPLWLALDDDGVVAGMCGHIPFVAHAAGADIRGAWIVDFFVSQRFQGQGLGKRLVRAIGENFSFLASLNQTDAAYATFSRSGWTERQIVPLMIAASPRAYRVATTFRRTGGVAVQRGPVVFGDEFDAFWSTASQSVVAAVRDRAALAARFTDSAREYHLLRASRGGVLAGYLVLRVLPPGSIRSFSRFSIVMVSDYLVPPEQTDVFAGLMREATRFATEQRIRFVLCMSTHPSHQRALAAGGFLWHRTPLVGDRLRKLAVGFTATPTSPSGHWHLTPFDCDLDILFGGCK